MGLWLQKSLVTIVKSQPESNHAFTPVGFSTRTHSDSRPTFVKGNIVTRLTGYLFGFACVCLLGGVARAQDASMADVLASSPKKANAIFYADVPSLRSLTNGKLVQSDLPESLGEVRIAAELNLKLLQPAWEIGYVTLKGAKSAELIAKSINGYVDSIAGKKVVWSPRQSYLIPFENSVLGIVRPTDRKLAASWLSKEATPTSAAYLKQHAGQATKFLSLMLAVDLQDTLSPIAVEQKIESFESLKGKDLQSIATTLSTVRGIQIIIGRKNLDECIISLDFGSSPSLLLPVAKEFFGEVLSRNGTAVSDASKWTASVEGNTLAFRGTISAETIDHLMGIFTLQSQAADLPTTELESAQGSVSESMKLEATKAYFAKSSSIIKRVREYSASNTGDRARWNGQMARRIDDIPTLNVDPELVEFGVKVAAGLRGNMVALQQSNIKAGTQAVVDGAGNPQIGYYEGYGYGGIYYDANSTYKYNAVAQGQGNYMYRELIAKIDEMEAEIRRNMTEKYKVQF